MKKKFKLIDIVTLKKVTSLFAGNYKTSFHWTWIEFEDLREYNLWDDIKYIDWSTSAKTWKTFIKKYQEERELCTIFVCDIWWNMQFWTQNKNISKLDTLLEIFYLLWLSSFKNNDKIWAYLFDSKIQLKIPPKKWQTNLWLIINKIIEYKKNNNINISNLNILLKELYTKEIKNNLIFILTDEYKNLNDKYFKALAIKNDIIFINIFDDFENNLNINWIFNFTNISIYNNIQIQNKWKKEKYILERKKQKDLFKKKIVNLWWNYLEITNSTNIYQVFYKFFKLRQNIS